MKAPGSLAHLTCGGWDYSQHRGGCHPDSDDGVWTVCCTECAGTGVYPVPWIRSVDEGRHRDDASCVTCKGTGRALVSFAATGPAHA